MFTHLLKVGPAHTADSGTSLAEQVDGHVTVVQIVVRLECF